MEKIKAFFAKAEKWVDDHPRMTLVFGVVAVSVLSGLAIVAAVR